MPGTGPGNVSTLDDKTRTAMRPTPVALLGPGEQPRLSGYPSRQVPHQYTPFGPRGTVSAVRALPSGAAPPEGARSHELIEERVSPRNRQQNASRCAFRREWTLGGVKRPRSAAARPTAARARNRVAGATCARRASSALVQPRTTLWRSNDARSIRQGARRTSGAGSVASSSTSRRNRRLSHAAYSRGSASSSARHQGP